MAVSLRDMVDQYRGSEIPWLQYPFLARGIVTTVSGAANAGKSTFILQLLKRAADGKPWFLNLKPSKEIGRSLYYSLELGPIPLTNRVLGLWSDEEIPADLFVNANPTLSLRTPDEWKMLEQAVAETRAGILVLDPVFGVNWGRGFDSNKNESVAEVMNRAREMAVRLDISVVLVLHHRKPAKKAFGEIGMGDPLDEASGSKMFNNRAEIRIVIEAPEGARTVRRTIQVRSRLGPPHEIRAALENGAWRRSQKGDYSRFEGATDTDDPNTVEAERLDKPLSSWLGRPNP